MRFKQNLRFFASGENLLTITDLVKFFDPETIESGSFAHGYAYPLLQNLCFRAEHYVLIGKPNENLNAQI